MKKFVAAVLVLVLLFSFTALAKSVTFSKGTTVFIGGKEYKLTSSCALNVVAQTTYKGLKYYKVQGKGSYSGLVGYIITGAQKGTGYKHIFKGIDAANLRDKYGSKIGSLKAGAKVYVYGYKRFSLGGRFAYVKCGSKYGYVWANLLY